MDNLINVFMNYKIQRLTEYGVFFFQEDNSFIRQIFQGYFRTFVDNYYYGIFNTIDDDHYTLKNLKLEFDGIMVEMLEDYRSFELQVSNEEYQLNRKLIETLNPISFEVVKIDLLKIQSREDIVVAVSNFLEKNKLLKSFSVSSSKLISMVRDTYQTSLKLLNIEDSYFSISKRMFENQDHLIYLELSPNVKVLDVFRSGVVDRVYRDSRLEEAKLECLVQKISLNLLKSFLNHEKIDTFFLEMSDSVISRGKIKNSIMKLIDNPMFRKYVVIGIHFNTYLNQKAAFSEDYQFACIQDFTHINDVYQKTDAIYKEGIFNYLIVKGCKYRDRDYFLNYQNDTMKVLVFEEE